MLSTTVIQCIVGVVGIMRCDMALYDQSSIIELRSSCVTHHASAKIAWRDTANRAGATTAETVSIPSLGFRPRATSVIRCYNTWCTVRKD